MRNHTICRLLAAALALMLCLSLLPMSIFAATTYTLDIGDVEDVAQGSKADGDHLKCGTDEMFTIFFSAKARLESNSKTFSDGFSAEKRLNFGASTKIGETVQNCVGFTCVGPATVTVWWVSGGDGREVAIYDKYGTVLAQSNEASVKNSLYVTQLQVDCGGSYFVGNIGGNNNYYKLEVADSKDPGLDQGRPPWSIVDLPKIMNVEATSDGKVKVTVEAVVGSGGGDELRVYMLDAQGKEVALRTSVLGFGTHVLTFEPEASGKYTFRALLVREGEADKEAAAPGTAQFTLPLQKTEIISATSKGGGNVEVAWNPVPEAESYEIFCDGKSVGTTANTAFTVTGLTVGNEYSFRVDAIRGNDRTSSAALSATASSEEKVTWGFTYYGPSTNSQNNGYEGSINEDGSVTVYSENGKGKIVPGSVDGVAFYYTAIPTTHNFTLKARVTVDSWTYSNGQEGFGLLATDRLGEMGNSGSFWNNQYMVMASKVEYCYDPDTMQVYEYVDSSTPGIKYSMKLGLGVTAKTGVTPENLPLLEANDNQTITTQFSSRTRTLEWAAGDWNKEKGTYNIIGNSTSPVSGTIENEVKTTFILELQKNNTGYFITYYAEDGTVLAQEKYYDPDALNQLDKDYVYAGFFAARNARATFSEVELTTIPKELDAPAEEKPVIKIEPSVQITSPTVVTTLDYPLTVDTNVDGTLVIKLGVQVVAENVPIQGGVRYKQVIQLQGYGANRLQVEFTPDPNQDLGPDTVLSSKNMIPLDATITASKGFYHTKTIYVSPEGLPNGNGTREYPFDIYTAVNNVVAGQTIVLMEGTYKLRSTVKIQRGMDGTEDAPIRMIADPEAKTRPVLDFGGYCAGIVHGGNHWYFRGFDVTNSQAGQKGFQVSGNYNTLDQINAYHNGDTGIQISRYTGTDLFPDWPAYNLILNCTSYGNADPGYEDADGFAAKLTVGEGNVFDGCVAYNNADDGWDMYAKVETGPIGAVTVRNCIAYSNGILEDGTIGGNGNGFKLGGDSLSGKHVLENSWAFWNRAKGIDSNSCPDVKVFNCISYNNGSHNVALYTNNAANTDFTAEGIISFKDDSIPFPDGLTTGDKLSPKGTQDKSKFLTANCYYWYGSASTSTGGNLASGIFDSVEFKGIQRNADGTLDLQGFLVLNDKAPADAGSRPSWNGSMDMPTPGEDEKHNVSADWYTEDPLRHWHECDCGHRADMGDHELVWIVDREATPEATGSKHQECTVCGHKKPAVTTYYEEPTEPTDAPADHTDPTDPSAQPAPADHTGTIIIVVVLVLAAAAVVILVIRKKKA